jgi:carboxypeptidase PM20D1
MWILIPIVIIFLAIILIRALMFKPRAAENKSSYPVFVNGEKAVHDLAEMIKCKTVSNRDASLDDQAEFDKFEALLPELFPAVYSKCSFEKVGTRGLLLRWKGKSPDAPSVFMSHYDVVSVEEKDWEKPAFDGVVDNGVLWGRGTIDTKGTLNGILQAAESLINEGFVPKNDIYFAFGGNEEVNGDGSYGIVQLFKERGITPGLVIDEGGADDDGARDESGAGSLDSASEGDAR